MGNCSSRDTLKPPDQTEAFARRDPPPPVAKASESFSRQLEQATANATGNATAKTLFTWQDIDNALHQGQLYVVAKGRYVYNINQWIFSHPGGQIVLNQVCILL